ncbi:MAG: hypothetical protein KC506_01235 [Nanoarchaeota archaeon]|nr:hypothetical protein [Nanoarchaeota archaeon]
MSKGQLGVQTTVIWFLFLLLIIVGSLGAGIYMFFGSGYDARQIDAENLNIKIKACLSENEFDTSLLNPESREKFEKDFYTKCKINHEVVKQNQFIYITFPENKIYEEGKGDPTQCTLQDKNELFPRCSESTITKNSKTIKIQTGSNQQGHEVLI